MPVPVRRTPTFPVHPGRRVAVTGGARGIGAAIVRRLVAEGARVAIVDTAVDEAATLARELGAPAVVVPGDVAATSTLPSVVAACADALGGLDDIVGNAGTVVIRPAVEHTIEDWNAQLAVNLTGAFEFVRLAVPHLRAAEGGAHVVFVSSESGKRGHVQMLAYNAAKAAVINITRVLAEEWAPLDINVNCVCPGSVATDMLRDVALHFGGTEGAAQLLGTMISPHLGRHVESDEVARVVSMLLSPAADAIRGQAINVDGGVCPY